MTESTAKLENWIHTLTKPQGFTSHSQMTNGKIFVALKGAKVDGHAFIAEILKRGDAAGFVVHQDFSLTAFQAHKHLFYQTSDVHHTHRLLAAHFRTQFKGTLIGVGGSSGKTSTKEFLYQILSKKFKCFKTEKSQNGELGIPKTLEQLHSSFQVGIVEIGIDAPGDMIRHANLVKPDIAVLTSIGEEHLNLLHSVENVFKEEKILFEVTEKNQGKCFAPSSDLYLARLNGQIQKLTLVNSIEKEFALSMSNPYARQNASLAIAVAQTLGMTHDEIAQALLSLELPEGRGREVTLSKGRLVIADHYNANPSSMKAGFDNLHQTAQARTGKKVLILGDMLDLGVESANAHQSIVPSLVNLQAALVALIGPELEKIAPLIQASNTSVVLFKDSKQASLAQWDSLLPEGSTILLKGSRGMALENVLNALPTQQ